MPTIIHTDISNSPSILFHLLVDDFNLIARKQICKTHFKLR